ncbi:MAG: NAD(+)/NADH kinase, partial [Nitrospinales bacterium]
MGSVKKVGIFCKHKPEISGEILVELSRWLREHGCTVFLDRDTAQMIQETSDYQKTDIPPLVDLIIVLGGDGTLLSVARITHPYNVPLLAVNLGSLGFLTEISLPELYGTLEKSLKNELSLDKRMLLNVCLLREGEKV